MRLIMRKQASSERAALPAPAMDWDLGAVDIESILAFDEEDRVKPPTCSRAPRANEADD